MADVIIFLYGGESNPNDVKLTDPTVLNSGAPAINGDVTVEFAVTNSDITAREVFRGDIAVAYVVTASDAVAREVFRGTTSVAFDVTQATATAREVFRGDITVVFPVTQTTATSKLTFRGSITVLFPVTTLEPPSVDFLLTEASDHLLLETGDKIFLEQQVNARLVFRGPITWEIGTHTEPHHLLKEDGDAILTEAGGHINLEQEDTVAGGVTQSFATGTVSAVAIVGNITATFPVTQVHATGTIPFVAEDTDSRGWFQLKRHSHAQIESPIVAEVLLSLGRVEVSSSCVASVTGVQCEIAVGRVNVSTSSHAVISDSVEIIASLSLVGTVTSARSYAGSVKAQSLFGSSFGIGNAHVFIPGFLAHTSVGRVSVSIGPDLVQLEDEEILWLLEVA